MTPAKAVRALDAWYASPIGSRFAGATKTAADALRTIGMRRHADNLCHRGVTNNPVGGILVTALEAAHDIEVATRKVRAARDVMMAVRPDVAAAHDAYLRDAGVALMALHLLRDVVAEAATMTLETALTKAEPAKMKGRAKR